MLTFSTKKEISKIESLNTNSDPKFDEFLLFIDSNLPVESRSKSDLEENIQQMYISKTKEFLSSYSPLYTSIKNISLAVNDIEFSLLKMEDYLGGLHFRDKTLLKKVEKHKEKEQIIMEKKKVLDELIQKSLVEKETYDMLLDKNIEVSESFFNAFEKLEKINLLQKELKEIDSENKAFLNSLEKNLNEIYSIGYSKLIAFLNKNLENIDVIILNKSANLLKPKPEFFLKFFKTFLNFRKNFQKNKLLAVLNNIKLVQEKDQVNLISDLFTNIENEIEKEECFLNSIFWQCEIEVLVFLEFIFFECVELFYHKTVKNINIEKNDIVFGFLISSLIEKKGKKIINKFSQSFNLNDFTKFILSELPIKIETKTSTFFKNLENSCENSVKTIIQNFSEQLQNTKFNIKTPSSYMIITEFISKIKFIYNNYENLESRKYLELNFLLKPILDLIYLKLNTYKNALQSLIFCLNLYYLIICNCKSIKKFEENYLNSFEKEIWELGIKIREGFLLEIKKFFDLDLFENCLQRRKKINFKNKNNESDKNLNLLKENCKVFLSFFNKLFENENYKKIFWDVHLIYEEKVKEEIADYIIKYVVESYEKAYSEVMFSVEFFEIMEKENIELEKVFAYFGVKNNIKIELFPKDVIEDLLRQNWKINL